MLWVPAVLFLFRVFKSSTHCYFCEHLRIVLALLYRHERLVHRPGGVQLCEPSASVAALAALAAAAFAAHQPILWSVPELLPGAWRQVQDVHGVGARLLEHRSHHVPPRFEWSHMHRQHAADAAGCERHHTRAKLEHCWVRRMLLRLKHS